MILNLGFLGGDSRMGVASDFLKSCGHEASVWKDGTDMTAFCAELDLLVLPYPATRDGVTVNGCTVRFCALPLAPRTAIFGGRLPMPWREGRRAGDAEEDEAFLLGNAYLTAAAGVGTALRATERAFFRTDAAVLGYGRIGKATAAMLRALGASVTVYVRREEARAEAQREGFAARLLEKTKALPEALVFGTAPSPAENLAHLYVTDTALIYDLGGGLPAALPCQTGTVRVLPLRGAPGVFAPKAAGELYGAAVLDFMKGLDPL